MTWKRLVVPFAAVLMASSCTKVIYVSEPAGQAQLHELDVTTGALSPVGSNPLPGERFPDLSADGERIAYIGEAVDGVRQVFVMNSDGTGRVQRTFNPGDKSSPRWAPDGSLAYARSVGASDPCCEVVVEDPAGNSIDLGPTPVMTDGGLDFIENGARIVYERGNDLYVMTVGPNPEPSRIIECATLSTPPTRCRWPVSSHDGTMFAYVMSTPFAPGTLSVIHVRRVGTWAGVSTPFAYQYSNGRIAGLDFSPDDEAIYFSALEPTLAGSSPGDQLELYSVNLDGSDRERLTDNDWPDFHPSTYLWP